MTAVEWLTFLYVAVYWAGHIRHSVMSFLFRGAMLARLKKDVLTASRMIGEHLSGAGDRNGERAASRN